MHKVIFGSIVVVLAGTCWVCAERVVAAIRFAVPIPTGNAAEREIRVADGRARRASGAADPGSIHGLAGSHPTTAVYWARVKRTRLLSIRSSFPRRRRCRLQPSRPSLPRN
jgi:hypothetical protein